MNQRLQKEIRRCSCSHSFFPGLSGILAIALYGVIIKLADEEDFYIA